MSLLIREQEKRSQMCCLDPLTWCFCSQHGGMKLLCAGGETAGKMGLWSSESVFHGKVDPGNIRDQC